MPSRKLTRLLTTPLSRPLVPAVEYRASASTPFDPVSMFAGGKNGWLLDGLPGKSSVLVADGGAECVDLDPMGYFSDLSGNGNHIVQATSGVKPVCRIDNGIRSIKITSGKAIETTLAAPMPATRTEVFVLFRAVSGSNEAYGPYTHSTTFDATMFRFLRVEVLDGNVNEGSMSCGYTAPKIYVKKKITSGGGAGLFLWEYSMAGAVLNSATLGYTSTDLQTDLGIGFNGYAVPDFWIPFSLGIEGDVDVTALIAYLVAGFGAWSSS